MTSREPQWIVNNFGELGVEVDGRFFFLYKGLSIEYTKEGESDDELKYRPVLKREFGESCIPEKYVSQGYSSIPGHVDFVAESDGWKELPLK